MFVTLILVFGKFQRTSGSSFWNISNSEAGSGLFAVWKNLLFLWKNQLRTSIDFLPIHSLLFLSFWGWQLSRFFSIFWCHEFGKVSPKNSKISWLDRMLLSMPSEPTTNPFLFIYYCSGESCNLVATCPTSCIFVLLCYLTVFCMWMWFYIHYTLYISKDELIILP